MQYAKELHNKILSLPLEDWCFQLAMQRKVMLEALRATIEIAKIILK
jgi:hypothetical protein